MKDFSKVKRFTIVPSDVIDAVKKNVSLAALGLFTLMASKPNDWVFNREALCNEARINRQTFVKYINELIDAGWIIREQENKGCFKPCSYILNSKYKKPIERKKKKNTVDEKTVHDNFVHDNSVHEKNVHLLNTDNTKKDNSKKDLFSKHTREEKLSSINQSLLDDSEWVEMVAQKNEVKETEVIFAIERTIRWMFENAKKLTIDSAKSLVQRDFDIMKQKATLEQRGREFAKRVREVAKPFNVPESTLGEYWNYYTAADEFGKMRFEGDRYFSINVTLKKWIEQN